MCRSSNSSTSSSEDEKIDLLAVVQKAEGVRVINNLTLKHHTTNQNFTAPAQYPMGPIPGYCSEDWHIEMAEEFRNEEFYGHLIFLNIRELIQPISTGFMGGPPFHDHPHNLQAILEARDQGGIMIEAHGLGRNANVPVDVAHGLADSLDQLDPVDYYRFLDCGFQLPLSNGSDHPARLVGACRVYVNTALPFTYERWPRRLPNLVGDSAEDILEALLTEVDEHRRGRPAADDVTALVLKMEGC